MIARCLERRSYIIRRAMGQGLYPGVCQKSLDIDWMFGLHKQLIVSCEGADYPQPHLARPLIHNIIMGCPGRAQASYHFCDIFHYKIFQ